LPVVAAASPRFVATDRRVMIIRPQALDGVLTRPGMYPKQATAIVIAE
jgi:hypothetical protein